MNKCIFVGNLTRDPEMGSTGSGIQYCRFSIAVNRPYTNANGEREADFINIVAWRVLAERCGKYLFKGTKVAVCGSLQNSSYTGQDGTKRYRSEIVAEDVEFLSNPRQNDNNEEGVTQETPRASANKKVSELKPVETDEDDFPF